jgi:hypothetical protein
VNTALEGNGRRRDSPLVMFSIDGFLCGKCLRKQY